MFDNLTTTQMYWIFGVIGVLLSMTVATMIAAYRRFSDDPVKMMIWVQVSIIPFFGALAYLFIARKHGEKK